jgi:hypothetical protein
MLKKVVNPHVISAHKFVSGRLQLSHSLHWEIGAGKTWSPGPTLWTPGPTDSTTPAASWPATCGKRKLTAFPDMPWESETDLDLNLKLNLGLGLIIGFKFGFEFGLEFDLNLDLNWNLDFNLDLDLSWNLDLNLDLE